jgi:hypothetical protein
MTTTNDSATHKDLNKAQVQIREEIDKKIRQQQEDRHNLFNNMTIRLNSIDEEVDKKSDRKLCLTIIGSVSMFILTIIGSMFMFLYSGQQKTATELRMYQSEVVQQITEIKITLTKIQGQLQNMEKEISRLESN